MNGDPFYATFDFCTGQCWYDQDVMTPKGQPDTVFVIGSYAYGELGGRSNARAVLRSTTAGEPDPAHNNRTFTDMTWDAQSPPYGIHPDQHELAFHPTNPNIWWSTSDGGVVRSSGEYVDISSQCDTRPIGAASMLTCNRLLSAVPSKTFSLNEGLKTLQFMSVSVNPQDPTGEVQGGTQDNGTWLFTGNTKVWTQTIYGDGGTSGFDVGNPAIRFNQFFGGFGDVNFRSGDPTAWVVVTAPMLNSGEAVGFYWPEIADPSVAGTMYTGFRHVWRTKDNAGNQSFLEANCPEFTTPGNQVGCGDWVALGGPGGTNQPGDLASATLRRSRRRHDGPSGARTVRYRHAMGVDIARTAVHHEERRRGTVHRRGVHAARLARGERSEPVHQRHLRGPVQPEPGVGLVLGVQHDDRLDGAGTRIRGHVQSRRPERDVGRSELRSRRPADHRRRA